MLRALILAAGKGTRLAPESDALPKCLVDVGGTTILAHQLRNCAQAGLNEAIVITGYHFEKVDTEVSHFIGASQTPIRVRTSYNPFYDVSNNLVSLWTARHAMHDGFVLINGDDVFDGEILERLLSDSANDIVVTVDTKPAYDADDMKVSLKDGLITQINKEVAPSDTHAESIGIMKFTKRGAKRLFEELETMVRLPAGITDWFTKAVERIANSGFEVGVVDIQGLRWAEIDFPDDLRLVRENFTDLVK